jgi:hypothetical protein
MIKMKFISDPRRRHISSLHVRANSSELTSFCSQLSSVQQYADTYTIGKLRHFFQLVTYYQRDLLHSTAEFFFIIISHIQLKSFTIYARLSAV